MTANRSRGEIALFVVLFTFPLFARESSAACRARRPFNAARR
jgi:hypothetical protein